MYYRKPESTRRLKKLLRVRSHKAGIWVSSDDGRIHIYWLGRVIKPYAKYYNKRLRHIKDVPSGRAYKKIAHNAAYEAF